MARKRKAVIPDNIAEEYYQISNEILSSFPKYRPPVDLFQFRPDITQLYQYSRKGSRLSNEQVEELQILCEEGNLFVSRTDHPIYSQHIVKQVDLVLLDSNLKESESTDIIIRALHMRFDAFVEQPVLPVFETLYRDLMVFTEYLWQDRHRIRSFMRRLLINEKHTLINHSLNTLFVGIWLFMTAFSGEGSAGDGYTRRQIDRASLGFILHDIGMRRVPAFIVDKTNPLKPEERDKILHHTIDGIQMLQKLNLGFDELTQAVVEHHERLDGSGYPNHIKEEASSRFGRLCAVADSFAAMITDRPYAEKKDTRTASAELIADKTHYDAKFSALLFNAYATNTFGDAVAIKTSEKTQPAAE